MTVAAAIRRMLDAGLTIDQALIAAEAFEATPPRSKGAERTARWRANRASQSVPVTDGDACDGGEEPSFLAKETPRTPKENSPSIPTTHEENPLRGQKKGSRLPSDFDPDREFALGLGLSVAHVETEVAKFRDYWLSKAGKDATKTDWQATWRNWARTAAERRPPSRGSPTKPATAQEILKAQRQSFLDDGSTQNGPRLIAAR